jgi:hypothetical protein
MIRQIGFSSDLGAAGFRPAVTPADLQLLRDARDVVRRLEARLAQECAEPPPGLLTAIAEAVGDAWFSAAELLENAREVSPALLAELEKVAPTLSTKSVGWALSSLEAADHPSLRVERGPKENGARLRRVVARAF